MKVRVVVVEAPKSVEPVPAHASFAAHPCPVTPVPQKAA
jgi:hypothetical protein